MKKFDSKSFLVRVLEVLGARIPTRTVVVVTFNGLSVASHPTPHSNSIIFLNALLFTVQFNVVHKFLNADSRIGKKLFS